MAFDAEVNRWLMKAVENGYELCDLKNEQIRQLLDAGLLVAPPAPPPEVTFRTEAINAGDFGGLRGVYINATEVGAATRGLGFRPGATLEVTVRQVEG